MDYFKVLSDNVSSLILEQNLQEKKSNLIENRKNSSKDISKDFLKITEDYIGLLENIDIRCKKVKSYKSSLQKKLNFATDNFLKIANSLENNLPLNKRRHVRELFRKNVGRYIFQSQLLKRFYEKPLGYAGDYFMFEMIYNEQPISKGIGYYFDKYVLEYALIQAVINRKNIMKQLLKKAIELSGAPVLKILNIGCGSCREIKELLEEINPFKKIQFSLVDQDSEGFKFVCSNIQARRDNVNLIFSQENILTLLDFTRKKMIDKIFSEKKNLIYSVGLVDYFLNNTLDRFLSTYFSLLSPGGKLIIASCSDKRLFYYAPLRWFCEWNFYYRDPILTKSRIERILDVNSIKIIWGKNKQIFFLIIQK